MNAHRFDSLTRSLTDARSRRNLLRGLAGAALGMVAANLPEATAAKKKHKRKKATPNQFGCLNIGQQCRGNSALCCSGVCAGKKPKKGKPDKRKCAAHNVGGCTPERSACVASSPALSFCPTPPEATASCLTTTGNAGFCASGLGSSKELNCQTCTKDADCEAIGFAPGAACVIIHGPTCGNVCAATEGRACFPPAAAE